MDVALLRGVRGVGKLRVVHGSEIIGQWYLLDVARLDEILKAAQANEVVTYIGQVVDSATVDTKAVKVWIAHIDKRLDSVTGDVSVTTVLRIAELQAQKAAQDQGSISIGGSASQGAVFGYCSSCEEVDHAREGLEKSTQLVRSAFGDRPLDRVDPRNT